MTWVLSTEGPARPSGMVHNAVSSPGQDMSRNCRRGAQAGGLPVPNMRLASPEHVVGVENRPQTDANRMLDTGGERGAGSGGQFPRWSWIESLGPRLGA